MPFNLYEAGPSYEVGLMGFGRVGRGAAAILPEQWCKETNLQWVLRRSTLLEHRSLCSRISRRHFRGPTGALIHSKNEFTPVELLIFMDLVTWSSISCLPTDRHYDAEEAAKWSITIVSAVSLYSPQ